MKRPLLLIIALILAITLFACDEKKDADNAVGTDSVLDLAECYTTLLPAATEKTLFVQFEIEGGAAFVVELYPQYAPQTVTNFQNLVADGFYDGLTFHRVYKNFMIQGGCPNGDGTGSTDTIPGEFHSNGYTANTLKHGRGVISMARRSSPDSASCQFFIMHAAASHLDGKYAAFGRVVYGMETIDAIANAEVTLQDVSNEPTKPVKEIRIKAATFVNLTPQSPSQGTQATGSLDLSACYQTLLPAVEEKTQFVQFEIEGGATFVVELYPQYAPQTVANFQNLVADGFYNGLTFHRVYKGFMIQGGCPKGDGTGSTTPIPGEFASNGYAENTLKHERGVISMARRTDPNSASCQFFIMHAAAAHLDGSYAAFGRVVAGMETIDAIANVEHPAGYERRMLQAR